MKILDSESAFLREAFVDTFVDTTCAYYKERIQTTHIFPDGPCYTGYLWDCMPKQHVVSQNHIMHILQSKTTDIYVLWDIHSSSRIFIKDYWKYPKNAVLSLSPGEVEEILDTLPEDCYFFDDTLTWAAVLTHEEIKPGRRFCIYVSTEPGRTGTSLCLNANP